MVVVLCSGCFNHVVIPTSELKQLDGFDVHNERSVTMVTGTAYTRYGAAPIVSNVAVTDRPYRLLTTEGEPVDFTSRTSLTLVSGTGPVAYRFREVHVSDVLFSAVSMMGDPVSYDLSSIKQVETEVPSMGKTLGLMFGIGGGVVIVMTVVLVVILSSFNRGLP